MRGSPQLAPEHRAHASGIAPSTLLFLSRRSYPASVAFHARQRRGRPLLPVVQGVQAGRWESAAFGSSAGVAVFARTALTPRSSPPVAVVTCRRASRPRSSSADGREGGLSP